ncbi:MAG: efflux RND transporter periplasmic adaptor subunit [Lacipirellulaceae bacterium]
MILLTLVALTVGGAFAATKAGSTAASAESEEIETNTPLPVSTFTVEQINSYVRQRDYTGILRESRRSQLGFQRGGEVVELSVDEGDRVEADQVIGKLDTRHIEARREHLKAQRLEAEAILLELVNGPRKETIAAKRAELETLRAQLKVLEKQLARRAKLVQGASVSQEEYETYLHETEAAAARVTMVERQLEELVVGTRQEKKTAQQARLDQINALLEDLDHDAEDALLRAPYAGRIASRMVDEGIVIQAGTPVVEIVDDTHLEAWVGLPASTAATLSKGSTHTLLVDGYSVQAEVSSLAPEVDRTTRTRNVILDLVADAGSGESGPLPGQVFRFAAEQRVEKNGYWVPTTALSRSTRGLWSVFVVEPAEEGTSTAGSRQGKIARRDVELLDNVDDRSFVRGTLRPGDQVVTSGTHRVVVGQRVVVDPASLVKLPETDSPSNAK